MKIDALLPGGIEPGDYLHVGRNDGTCSRCRERIPEDDVPLLIWLGQGDEMYAFCRACLHEESRHD